MAEWILFALGLATCAVLQWGLLAWLPLSLTYYEDGMARRRRIRLGTLITQAFRHRVELHGPLLYLDTGRERGMVGGSWAALALAALVVGPWILQTDLLHKPATQ